MKSKQERKLKKGVLAAVPKLVGEPAEVTSQEVMLRNMSGTTTFHIRIATVTPAMASRWLEKNHPDNRPVSWGRVEAMANDIRNGAWKILHQAVAFGENGYLIDGQHRLHAIVAADTPAECLIIRNEQASYHDPIDRGGARGIATIMGVNTRLAAAFNVIRWLEAGYENHTPMTLADAEVVHERFKKDLEKLNVVRNRSKILGPALAACVWAVPIAPEKVIDFASKLATGEMIQRGDPVFAFRSWLERNKRVGSWPIAMATLGCLRYYIHGATMSNVYPQPAGYRAITSRRRALKIPNTPDADVVPGIGWAPDARGKLIESDE